MILILKCRCTQTRSSTTVPSNWRLEETLAVEKEEKEICSQDLKVRRLKATCPVCLRVEQCEKENKKNDTNIRI